MRSALLCAAALAPTAAAAGSLRLSACEFGSSGAGDFLVPAPGCQLQQMVAVSGEMAVSGQGPGQGTGSDDLDWDDLDSDDLDPPAVLRELAAVGGAASNNTRHFIIISAGAMLQLSYLNLTGGRVSAGGASGRENWGGSILTYPGSYLGIHSVLFDGCRQGGGGPCAKHGGAIFDVRGGISNITSSTFGGNIAQESGGAIYAESTITIGSCVFEGNQAKAGGAICTGSGAQIVFDDSPTSFTGNTAKTIGNSIYKWFESTLPATMVFKTCPPGTFQEDGATNSPPLEYGIEQDFTGCPNSCPAGRTTAGFPLAIARASLQQGCLAGRELDLASCKSACYELGGHPGHGNGSACAGVASFEWVDRPLGCWNDPNDNGFYFNSNPQKNEVCRPDHDERPEESTPNDLAECQRFNSVCAGATDQQKDDHGFTRIARGVCFNAINTPGKFQATFNGTVRAIRLAYINGSVTCSGALDQTATRWGCRTDTPDRLGVYLTSSDKMLLAPTPLTAGYAPVEDGTGKNTFYTLTGASSDSDTVVFQTTADNFFDAREGNEYQLWYGEALQDYTTSDNSGTVCADVYFDIHTYKTVDFPDICPDPCPAGYYCPGGFGTLPCPSNTYSNSGALSCNSTYPIDCRGSWSQCDRNCIATYTITAEAQDGGKACVNKDGDTASCHTGANSGSGSACYPPVDCKLAHCEKCSGVADTCARCANGFAWGIDIGACVSEGEINDISSGLGAGVVVGIVLGAVVVVVGSVFFILHLRRRKHAHQRRLSMSEVFIAGGEAESPPLPSSSLAINARNVAPGWRAMQDPDGGTYFCEDATGEVVWEAGKTWGSC